MKQVLEFIPLIIFFIVFKIYGIYNAIFVLMIACTIQLGLTFFLYKKIEKAQLITFIVTLVFGSLSLFFKNDAFIKWKVTIIYLIFALALIVSNFLRKPILKQMLAKEIPLPERCWSRLNSAWALFFISMATLNYYISTHYSTEIWVDFKVFGALGLMILFMIATGVYIYKNSDERLQQTLNADKSNAENRGSENIESDEVKLEKVDSQALELEKKEKGV